MPTVIDSLLVSLGFKVDDAGLEGYAERVEQIKSGAMALGAALGAAFAGVESMVHGAAERLGGIQNFAEQFGLSASAVDALGKVARANDSSLEEMESALKTVTMMAGQAAQGIGRGAMVFQKLGISAKDSSGHVKTTEELLSDVAGVLEKLPSKTSQQALGARLGFSPALIALLSEGKDKFLEMRDAAMAANPFRDQDYANADRAEKSIARASGAIQKLKERLAVGLIPTVERLALKFTDWVRDEKNIAKIQQAINAVASATEWLVRNADKLLAAFVVIKAQKYGAMFAEWGGHLSKFGDALKGADGKTAALKTAIGGLKDIATAGLLGLFAALAEDLWVYSQGGKSVVGLLETKFPYAVSVAESALVVLGAAFLRLSAGPFGTILAGIGAWIFVAKELKDAWNPIAQWWDELWAGMADTTANWYNHLPDVVRKGLSAVTGGAVGEHAATSAELIKSRDKIAADLGNNWGKPTTEDAPTWLRKKGEGSAGQQYAGNSQADFERWKNAFNSRTNKGLGPLAEGGAGNMLSWGAGSVAVGGGPVNVTQGPVTINVNGAQSPQDVAREVARAQVSRDRRAFLQARDAQAGHR